MTLNVGLAESQLWWPDCKQPPPARGQVHSGPEGCLATWGPHYYVEGPAPSLEPQRDAGGRGRATTSAAGSLCDLEKMLLGPSFRKGTWEGGSHRNLCALALHLQINSSGCQAGDCVMLPLCPEDAWGSSRDKQWGCPQNRNPRTAKGDC